MEKDMLAPGDGSESILARYETIRDYSRVMQRYALNSDWDRLIDLQSTYMQAMAELADAESSIVFDETLHARKIRLIHQIREAEQDIRTRLDRRMSELSDHMAEARQRRSAVSAYQSTGAA